MNGSGLVKLSSRHKYKIFGFFFQYLNGTVGAACLLLARMFLWSGVQSKGIDLLLKSIRFNYDSRATRLLKKLMPKVEQELFSRLGYQASPQQVAVRTIILSLPSVSEGRITKGVILVTFTTTFAFYLRHPQFRLIDKYFVFVLEPSWAGYAVPEVLLFLLRTEHCLIQSSEEKDRVLMNALFPAGVAMSFGASDWVNPDVFCPDGSPKRYDSIYVANLNPIKRAYRYIDAVANVRRHLPHYKACLVCAGWGGAADDLKTYIQSKGLGEALEFIPGLERPELVKIVNQSKVNVLLSFKEGSNRSLFEAMFADVPVICVAENIGVNKNYINEFTGLLVADTFLEDSLISMIDGWRTFQPRSWALANISPVATTRKLSELLKYKFGDACNSELAVKSNDPEVTYLQSDISSSAMIDTLLRVLNVGNENELLTSLSLLNLPPSGACIRPQV
jgi:glycosyltransferase involved in cell wall biosynthesis